MTYCPCVMLGDLTTCHSIESAWSQRLELKYDKLLSHFAFSFNLRRYTQAPPQRAALLLPPAVRRCRSTLSNPVLKAPTVAALETRISQTSFNARFFNFSLRRYREGRAAAAAAAAAPPAAPAPAVLTNPVQSGFHLWKKQASFQYALAPKKMKIHPDVLPGKPGKAGKPGKPGKPGKAGKAGSAGTVAAAAGADGAMSNVFSMVDSVRGNVNYHVNNLIDTVGDELEEAEERLKDAVDDMSGDVKAMLAARTLSLRETSARRRQYNRKLKWSSVLYQNLGWFLTAFTWIFGSYVIMAYGVLIYNYLGRAGRTVLATSSNAL